MEPRNIFLVGMMGAGKTTIGKALAQRLGLEFVDTDRVLVERTGVPVATIFEIEGEDAFRRRETAVLAEVAAVGGRVIATGGGAVLSAANREVMRASGTVVYLRARVDNLWERTRHDATRPLLATPNPRERLSELLAQREPLYRESAHVVVETGTQAVPTVLGRILDALRERPQAGDAP